MKMQVYTLTLHTQINLLYSFDLITMNSLALLVGWLQMLCEEQGSFLEIVDIIRGLGLNVLKGKMEIRENKIWARFIVEVKRLILLKDFTLVHWGCPLLYC